MEFCQIYVVTSKLQLLESNLCRCPDPEYARKMIVAIDAVRVRGDSVGGVVTCVKPPRGLGSPVFDKLEAELAKTTLSLPATKGFEFGSGFADIECFSYELAGSGYVFIPNRTNRLLSYLLNGTGYMNCLEGTFLSKHYLQPYSGPVNQPGSEGGTSSSHPDPVNQHGMEGVTVIVPASGPLPSNEEEYDADGNLIMKEVTEVNVADKESTDQEFNPFITPEYVEQVAREEALKSNELEDNERLLLDSHVNQP
ncbi:chorismate synthase 1, chloroplastic [Artemisia annua]|uniref:chorismate synthase n=1 Tax=Artemisia annua TaxID=35608 RepID=A0A2U1NSI1_ARTAN|nr:chorismate synthase 1, chloroplastic [Artemisia annua]